MKCKKCFGIFHACSACDNSPMEDFSFYTLSVCWSCFKAAGGIDAFNELEARIDEEKEKLKSHLEDHIFRSR